MNSQQRRAAADRRRNRRRRATSGGTVPGSFFRQRCPVCGGPVQWVNGPAVADVLGPDRLAALMTAMPADFRAEARADGQFWGCLDGECGESGVMLDHLF